jgi:lysophospholipase L1-like esterase
MEDLSMYRRFLKIVFTLALVTAISGCATVQKSAKVLPPPPAGFVPLEVGAEGKRGIGDYAMGRMKVFAAEDISKLQNGTVFLGDSITERYKLENYYQGMNVANRGIGGDTMGAMAAYGVYDRLSTCVYNLNPKTIILMIGINDIIWVKNVSLEKKFDQYAYLVWTLKKNLPNTDLYLVSTLPCKGKYAYVNEDVAKFNENIKKTAKKYGAKYLDVTPYFKNEKGELKAELANDDVHPSPAGYEILTKIYNKVIFKK